MQGSATFSVTQINEYIKLTLESSPVLQSVFIRGEISNFKSNYSSGHMYLSLKDENSSLRAVIFRSSAQKMRFMPENGMKVIAHGRISAYTVSGDCQIIIDDLQPDGAGALAVAFEQLKKKLSAEGLFAPERKKPIPKYPKSVGVITSASGAALHDIINVSGRRSPATEIIIYPSYVQGELAPRSLTGGILFFNNRHKVDVIIIGRGGGSAEDLWCFNDEALARAIAKSEIPVISAVGHETDFSISDFAADLRAPTPSAAAELAFPNTAEMLLHVKQRWSKAELAITGRINSNSARLELLHKSLELNSPIRQLKNSENQLEMLKKRLETAGSSMLDSKENDLKLLCTRLEGVNPLRVLSNGYGMIENKNGEIIVSASSVNVGDQVTVRLADGEFDASVTEKRENREGNR